MINLNALNGLFKPYKNETGKSIGASIIKSVGERKFWKMRYGQECSKSIDELCVNTKCKYNYLESHEDELYIDLMQEIKAEKLAIKKRDEQYRKEHGDVNA